MSKANGSYYQREKTFEGKTIKLFIKKCDAKNNYKKQLAFKLGKFQNVNEESRVMTAKAIEESL